MNAHTQITSITRPLYRIEHAPHTDNMCDPLDITDAWFEASGDDEQSAAAYFDHNNDFGQYNPTLVGLSVTDGDLTFYYSAAGAIALMGLESVDRIERAYSDQING